MGQSTCGRERNEARRAASPKKCTSVADLSHMVSMMLRSDSSDGTKQHPWVANSAQTHVSIHAWRSLTSRRWLPTPIRYVPLSCPLQRRQVTDGHVCRPVARMRDVCDQFVARTLPGPCHPASRMSSCAPTSYASATIAIARWLSPRLGNIIFGQHDGADPDLPSAIVHILAISASDPPGRDLT
jgi:hypothetical protein